MNEELFSKRLKEVMEERGLNQTQLAAAIGFSRKTINSYLNGRQFPDKAHLEKLVSFFGVWTEFFTGESMFRSIGQYLNYVIPETERERVKLEYTALRNFINQHDLDGYDPEEIQALMDEIAAFIQFKVQMFKQENIRKPKPIIHKKKEDTNAST